MASFFSSLLPSWLRASRTPVRNTRKPGVRLAVEALEDRALMSAGALDPTFNPGSGGWYQTYWDTDGAFATATKVQADGKILVVGVVTNAGTGQDFTALRFNADGVLDNTFGDGGRVTIDFGGDETANDVAIQADGRIVLVGRYVGNDLDGYGRRVTDFATARLNADGTPDTSFGINGNGKVTTDFGWSSGGPAVSPATIDIAYGVAIQPDGKIVVSGVGEDGAPYVVLAMARYTADGCLDTSFGSGGRVIHDSAAWGYDLALNSDGKMLVAGPGGLSRINPDGSLDTSFGTGGSASTPNIAVNALAVDTDGTIVLAGYAIPAGRTDFAAVRYDADGNLDMSFGTSGMAILDFGSPSAAIDVAIQPSGRIILAGYAYPGIAHFQVVGLTPTGNLDTSFGTGGVAAPEFDYGHEMATAVTLQADGKIVVAGVQNIPAKNWVVARFEGVNIPTLTVSAANAAYTGSAYDEQNLTTSVTPVSAAGSVSYVFYSDAAGQHVIATPINAGSYYVQAFFTSSNPVSYTDAQSGIVPFAITAKALSIDAATQGTINIAKDGTISFIIQITHGLVASNNNVGTLFNGEVFTILVNGTNYNLTSTATVTSESTIHVSMKMSQSLKNALLTALSQGSTVDFGLSALSSDLDYRIAGDAISRLISQGKLKYAVV